MVGPGPEAAAPTRGLTCSWGILQPEDLRSISFGQGRTDTFLEGSGQPGGLSSNVWDTPWGQTTALLDCTRVRASTHAFVHVKACAPCTHM